MEKYTRSNQYYEDKYDWETIQKMREYEKRIQQAGNDKMEIVKIQVLYNNYGAERASNRDQLITGWRKADERKDKLMAMALIPKNIFCKICNNQMRMESHGFEFDDKLIFYFTCEYGHLPKRAIYSDGSEKYIKITGCSDCAGVIETKKKRTKNKIVLTDTCKDCGKVEVHEFDLTEEKKPDIKEEDRIKYCISFIGSRTLWQDLQAILDFSEIHLEKEERYNYSHIEQLNIVQLEKRLAEEIEKVGFVKVSFEKPKAGRSLIVQFSAQDSLIRDEINSIKAIKKTITKSLFPTNWRLMKTGIYYKLGFLTGELKGYSLEEDLIKIGKEIDSKQKEQR